MGTLIDSIYKNIFITPEDDGLLQVFMKDKKLNKDTFKDKAKLFKVKNISVVAGELSQEDFNDLVQTIRRGTDKPTYLSFMPIMREGESVANAHKRYAYNYVSNNPKNVKEFPENLFINNVFVESDKETGNIKKKGF